MRRRDEPRRRTAVQERQDRDRQDHRLVSIQRLPSHHRLVPRSLRPHRRSRRRNHQHRLRRVCHAEILSNLAILCFSLIIFLPDVLM
ncbi:unnamed protein product [Linum tenue]|nr:unnamed protein product [Linum tenue]